MFNIAHLGVPDVRRKAFCVLLQQTGLCSKWNNQISLQHPRPYVTADARTEVLVILISVYGTQLCQVNQQ